MKKVFSFFVCSLLLFFSCNNLQNNEERKVEYQRRIDAIPRIVDSATYQKDSLQIINDVRWGLDNDDYFFNDFHRLGPSKTKYVSIYTDRIFYSKDSSKIFAIVIMETPIAYLPNTEKYNNTRYSYNGIFVVSSRKVEDKWLLIPVDWYQLVEFSSYDDVKYRFYYFLLENMLKKEYFDFYQCTIEQDCFWSEQNGYWRMGEIIEGYYNYEVKSNRDYFKATGIKVDSSNVKKYTFVPLQSNLANEREK